MSIFAASISRAHYVHHGLFVSMNGWSLAQFSVEGLKLDVEGFGAISGSDRKAENEGRTQGRFLIKYDTWGQRSASRRDPESDWERFSVQFQRGLLLVCLFIPEECQGLNTSSL